ncbi:folate family ECF transporter S component [Holzapfeliella sp. He02]|uniref:Folate family ECF transporter S component n=1 Tax=Holzapfeliella saturejae TaxID=3082953 RepID=A0ABU8SFK5_9LACO
MKNKSLSNINFVVIFALMVAISVVLQKITFGTPITQVGLGFIGTALMGRFFGPVWAGIGAGLADVLNSIILGVLGGFYPGFTLSAIATGVIYGLFLYRQHLADNWKNGWRIIASVLVVTVVVYMVMNTLWITHMTNGNFAHLFGIRLPKQLILPWIQMLILMIITIALDRVKIESILNRYSK